MDFPYVIDLKSCVKEDNYIVIDSDSCTNITYNKFHAFDCMFCSLKLCKPYHNNTLILILIINIVVIIYPSIKLGCSNNTLWSFDLYHMCQL